MKASWLRMVWAGNSIPSGSLRAARMPDQCTTPLAMTICAALSQVTKAVLERALGEEMTEHLGYDNCYQTVAGYADLRPLRSTDRSTTRTGRRTDPR